MFIKRKRGQAGLSQLSLAIIGLLVLALGIATAVNMQGGADFGTAFKDSWNAISGATMTVFSPLFTTILNLGDDSSTNFLKVITFILISIIIVSTLDSVNVFTPTRGGWNWGGVNLVNLAVGIIISIIGVRFMPDNMWLSLTAPSSAFVATILVGAPFLAMFFVTMKIKYSLASKLLWLFYVIFMSYLIFFPGGISQGTGMLTGNNDFAWIYTVFLILGVIMLFAEGMVRAFLFKQSGKYALLETLGFRYAERMAEISEKLNKLIPLHSKLTPKNPAKDILGKEIDALKAEYREISGKTFG